MSFRRQPFRDAADRAYGAIVSQARLPAFFTALGVPDTLDGRFELVCLHAFCFLRWLKAEGAAASALGQQVVDTMFADFDRSLREIGTGDLSVGRQVQRMAEAFYGRIRAYDDGLAGDDEALRSALERNVYGTATATPTQLERMAAYLRRETAALAAQPASSLLAGDIAFGTP